MFKTLKEEKVRKNQWESNQLIQAQNRNSMKIGKP